MLATVAFCLSLFFLVGGCQEGSTPKREVHPEGPALQAFVEGHGPPVVMLGGATEGAAAFVPHVVGLAKDYRVVRLQSLRIERVRGKQPLPKGYGIKTESAALARSLDQLGLREPVNLIGHSFGALVALDFALDHPDRVRTLVLAEPPAFWVVPPEELRADEEMRGMVELLRTFGATDEPTDQQVVQLRARLGQPGVKPLAPEESGRKAWDEKRVVFRGLAAVANHTDDPKRLQGLQRPVLIATGNETVKFHRRIDDRLAANLPRVERVGLTGGHSAPIVARDEFVTKLRAFLSRHR